MDINDYQEGDLARVRWLSDDRLRMMLAYQGGKSATITASRPLEFSVGDWVLVDEDGDRIWPVAEEAWPRDTRVGVVKLVGDSVTIIEVGSEQKIVEVAQTVEFEPGNTVEVDSDGKVLRVLSPDPIRYLDSHTVSDAVVDTFRTIPEDGGPSFDDFGGYPEVKARARELIETPLEHAARTESSRTVYACAWRQWQSWCTDRGLTALPGDPLALCAYLTERAEAGYAMGTLDLACTAIRHVHRTCGATDPVATGTLSPAGTPRTTPHLRHRTPTTRPPARRRRHPPDPHPHRPCHGTRTSRSSSTAISVPSAHSTPPPAVNSASNQGPRNIPGPGAQPEVRRGGAA